MTATAEPQSALVEESAPTTRCRILAAAERFFREIGYQKTTVADIAKSLGMSPANVYRFFDSKRSINEAVVARVTQEVQAQIEAAAVMPGLTAAERLAAIIETLHACCVERCKENPRIHEMVEAAMSDSWDVCRAHVERISAVLAGVVREGVRDGEFTVEDPDEAGRCLYLATTRYTHPVLVSQGWMMPDPDVTVMTRFLLRGLGFRERTTQGFAA